MSACDGEMITLNEFLLLYHLKASTSYGYFELLPWDRKSRIVRGFPSSFRDWKSRYFFISGMGWETLSDDFWGEVLRLLRKWEVPALGAYFHCLLLFSFHIVIARLMMFSFWFLQLSIILTWKIDIVTGFVLPLPTFLKLRILTTSLILVICLTAT